jgi:tRNA threonylcarbamoyl adenosine modification protein YeaZ
MKLLAIDTASAACSVGVVAGAATVLRSEILGRGHAERLMGMISEALDEAGLPAGDLDRIAVTIGPGPFTGLRVGIAAARGLALVTGCEAVGIGTLAVHAGEAREQIGAAPVLAVIAAGRGEIYGQLFDEDGLPQGGAEIAPAAHFALRMGANTMIAGSGAAALAEVLGDEVVARTVHDDASPNIATLCRLGVAAPRPSEPPRPLYVRAPDAKPQTGKGIARR